MSTFYRSDVPSIFPASASFTTAPLEYTEKKNGDGETVYEPVERTETVEFSLHLPDPLDNATYGSVADVLSSLRQTLYDIEFLGLRNIGGDVDLAKFPLASAISRSGVEWCGFVSEFLRGGFAYPDAPSFALTVIRDSALNSFFTEVVNDAVLRGFGVAGYIGGPYPDDFAEDPLETRLYPTFASGLVFADTTVRAASRDDGRNTVTAGGIVTSLGDASDRLFAGSMSFGSSYGDGGCYVVPGLSEHPFDGGVAAPDRVSRRLPSRWPWILYSRLAAAAAPTRFVRVYKPDLYAFSRPPRVLLHSSNPLGDLPDETHPYDAVSPVSHTLVSYVAERPSDRGYGFKVREGDADGNIERRYVATIEGDVDVPGDVVLYYCPSSSADLLGGAVIHTFMYAYMCSTTRMCATPLPDSIDSLDPVDVSGHEVAAALAVGFVPAPDLPPRDGRLAWRLSGLDTLVSRALAALEPFPGSVWRTCPPAVSYSEYDRDGTKFTASAEPSESFQLVLSFYHMDVPYPAFRATTESGDTRPVPCQLPWYMELPLGSDLFSGLSVLDPSA